MPKNLTTPAKLTAAERERRATKLRLAGATYQQIADELGMTRASAHGAVMRALRKQADQTAEDARELRQLEAERLDRLLLTATPLLQHEDPGVRLRAIDRIVRVSERRAKLLGIDGPSVLASIDLSIFTDQELAGLALGKLPHEVLARRTGPEAAQLPPAPPQAVEVDEETGEAVL